MNSNRYFEPRITLGNIITIAVFIATFALAFGRQNEKLNSVSEKVDDVSLDVAALRSFANQTAITSAVTQERYNGIDLRVMTLEKRLGIR